MPGIAGLVSLRAQPECERDVQHMLASMCHDPAYVYGSYQHVPLGLYAGWVARPASMAHAISSDSTGRIVACLAGECYLDDRASAPTDHHSDTRSRLLASVETLANATAAKLAGQFSALLLDRTRQKAYLLNDRLGMERLYVHENADGFYFASEAKALLAVLPETRALDERGVADFACFGSVLGGRTLFRGITLLPPGSLIELGLGGHRSTQRYFLPEMWRAPPAEDDKAFGSLFAETFRSRIAPYFATPSRVGLSITGGLDTRMLLACGLTSGVDAVCYTFDADSGLTLDSRIGAQVASMRGLSHHVIRLAPDFLCSFGDYVDRTVHVTDGCAGVMCAHEIPYNREARAIAPVRVTGNFGSEILRDMSTLKPLGLDRSLVAPWFREHVDQAETSAKVRGEHPLARAVFREIPWHLYGTLCAARSQLTVRAPFLDDEIVRLAFLAPARSRSNAEASLQLVARCEPDLARIPTDRGIALHANAFLALVRRLYCSITFKLDYLDKEGLPRARYGAEAGLRLLNRVGVLGLHKYLPYRRWFRTELATYSRDAIHAIAAHAPAFWEKNVLLTLASDHIAGRANRLKELHAVLTLDAVERTLIRGSRSATHLPPSLS